MRRITYSGRTYEVEILSLALPRGPGLMGRGHPTTGRRPKVTLVSSVEIPLGARFTLPNGESQSLEVKVLGCSAREDGRFAILGVVEQP